MISLKQISSAHKDRIHRLDVIDFFKDHGYKFFIEPSDKTGDFEYTISNKKGDVVLWTIDPKEVLEFAESLED